MITALHYIKVGGKPYSPGEIVEEAISPETLAWYREAGAVLVTEDAPQPPKRAGKREELAQEPPVSLADDAEEADAPLEIDAAEGIVSKPKGRRKAK